MWEMCVSIRHLVEVLLYPSNFLRNPPHDNDSILQLLDGVAVPFGEFQYSVDDKGRVIIPPTFRDFVGDGMIITRGFADCLYIYPLANWRNVEEDLRKVALTDTESTNFMRFFWAGASRANLDSAGRINISLALRKHADIGNDRAEKTVVIIGMPNRLELWGEERWLANLSKIDDASFAPEALKDLVG